MDGIGVNGRSAIRSLISDSKKTIKEAEAQKARAIKSRPEILVPKIDEVEDDDKRKEQIRLGKLFFEFNREDPPTQNQSNTDHPLRKRGRPKKPIEEHAKNYTISLSKEEVEQLDGLKTGRGRGSKVVGLMNYYVKHERRQKDQARAIKETLRVIGVNIDKYARNYKRADRFTENEQTLEDLDRSIQNLRIVLNLLKFDTAELKAHLTPQEFSHYEFALNFASNRKGDQ